jgi:hypothetical protein
MYDGITGSYVKLLHATGIFLYRSSKHLCAYDVFEDAYRATLSCDRARLSGDDKY